MVEAELQLYRGGLVRVGKSPKTLLTYRTDKPFKKVRSCTYEDEDGNCHTKEKLNKDFKGRTFISTLCFLLAPTTAPGHHPPVARKHKSCST
jgi:hypothetical protein